MVSETFKKKQELEVCKIFVRFLNKTYNKNYLEPKPSSIEPPDAISYSVSDNKDTIKMEETAADPEIAKAFNTKKQFLRIHSGSLVENFLFRVEKGIIKAIENKLEKRHYKDQKIKKDLVLLLNGWYGTNFSNKEMELIKHEWREYFKHAGFKEIWLIYIKNCYQLF